MTDDLAVAMIFVIAAYAMFAAWLYDTASLRRELDRVRALSNGRLPVGWANAFKGERKWGWAGTLRVSPSLSFGEKKDD